MKKRFSKYFLSGVCGAFLTEAPHLSAQTTSMPVIELYAGLNLTGKVGTVYSVEYVTNLARTNDWRPLVFVQLPSTNYLWLDPSAPAHGDRFYRAVDFGTPTNLVFIPPGTFRMGSPTTEVGRADNPDNEGPQTAVTITRGYWMGKYEVTQREYLAVMGSNPSQFKGDANRPVEMVSWMNATNYCARLTTQERSAGRIPVGSQFRLPTEAEWEYACRAWTSTRYSHGDDPDYLQLGDYAWTAENSAGATHPVGEKLPNPWGLYDMHGNVFEWVQDRYSEFAGGNAVDPLGPAIGSTRVIRDGSWSFAAKFARSAQRYFQPPTHTAERLGFRVVLAAIQP